MSSPPEAVEHPLITLADHLPFPLALLCSEYVRENNPFVKLHRLTDTAEMLTRFATMVLLNEVLRLHGEFPYDLRQMLSEKIERPTFSAWKDLLTLAREKLVREHDPGQLFVAELPDYVEQHLLPRLGVGEGDARETVIALRNVLAHGGRLNDGIAEEFLNAHQEEFEKLMSGLTFLDHYTLLACSADERVLKLRGLPRTDGSFAPFDASRLPVPSQPEHVLLSREVEGKTEALDLFPLQAYGEILQRREEQVERVAGEVSLVYFRLSGKGYLEFTPMSDHAAFAQRGGNALDRFNELYRLEEWRSLNAAARARHGSLFDDLVAELTEVFVGRDDPEDETRNHVHQVKDRIKARGQGVLWMAGKPGVGKSALMARLVRDYGQGKHYLVIPYFFRTGHPGCSTDAFVKTALVHLRWALDEVPQFGAHPEERRQQLVEAVRQAGERSGKKVLFLIDGLDEVYRLEPSFILLPFAANSPQVVWLCAGRSDPPAMEAELRQSGAQWVFPNGLPAMDEVAVRAMLTAHMERLKYQLFVRDGVEEGRWRNRFIEVITRKSEGLPLYVRMAVEDLREGKRTLADEDKLPDGLTAYYEQRLERLRVSDVGAVLTPLFCLLVWAKEPVTESALQQLLKGYHLSKSLRWKELFDKALEHGHLLLRREPTPEGQTGWTFYHDTFRHHLLTSEAMRESREWAQGAWLEECARWKTTEESLRRYALRHYARHLRAVKRWGELFSLARHQGFWRDQTEAFPEQPHLPLAAPLEALQGAAEADDAEAMAEFLLSHAHRLTKIAGEMPLDALREGLLKRAWALADLRDIILCSQWHLLLAWELNDSGRTHEARATLSRLIEKTLPRLPGWGDVDQHECDAFLVALTINVNHDLFTGLYQRLLGQRALSALCERLAETSRFNAAIEVAQTIEEESTRARMLGEIACAQALAGERESSRQTFAAALAAAGAIKEPGERDWPLSEIADSQAKAEEFAAALDTTQKIVDGEDRVRSMSSVAKAQADAGEGETALQTFALAVSHARSLEDPDERRSALKKIATLMSEAGELSAATELAEEVGAKDAADESPETTGKEIDPTTGLSPSDYFAPIEAIGMEIGKQSWHKGSRKILEIGAGKVLEELKAGEFEQAVATAEAISSAPLRVLALVEVAKVQAQMGELAGSRKTFDLAIKTAWDIKRPTNYVMVNPHTPPQAIFKIAMVQLKVGLAAEARRTVGMAIEFEKKVDVSLAGPSSLREIARVQKYAGDQDGSRRTFDHALELVQKIEDRSGRVRGIHDHVAALTRVGEFNRAHEIVSLLFDADGQVHLFQTMAKAQAEIGEHDMACRTFNLAAALAADMGDVKKRDRLLQGVARDQATIGKHADAARIAQMIEGQQLRAAVEEDVAAARASFNKRDAMRRDFTAEIYAAQKIDYLPRRVETLAEIAGALSRLGKRAAARQSWSTAIVSARKGDDEYERSRALREVVKSQASAGEFTGAVKVAKTIEFPVDRALALREIAKSQAAAGEFTEAVETAETIESQMQRAWALKETADALAEAGETEAAQRLFDAAFKIVRDDEDYRQMAANEDSRLLGAIAISQARTGMSARSLRTAAAILTDRQVYLTKIAVAFVEKKDIGSFKHMLVPCAYHLNDAYRMCGLLAHLYRDHATALAATIRTGGFKTSPPSIARTGRASTAHQAADPEQAFRLTQQHLKDLAAWRALPWWKRLFVKAPPSPEGI